MSTEVLTLIPEFDLTEEITFNTIISPFDTGKEQRRSLWDYGLRRYSLALRFYSEAAMNIIWNFYIARKGSYDCFLVKIPTEYSITGESIGTGNGALKDFQLDEFPVDMTAGTFILKVDGTPVSGTLLNDFETEIATATYSSAPGEGTALTADYEFYFQIRFEEDTLSRQLVAYQLLHSGMKLIEVRWPVQYHPRGGNV